MKNINDLVKMVQVHGSESEFFIELFEIINAQTIKPKTDSFSRQLKGDVAEGYHEGYVLLMELVHSWNGTGNFHRLYKLSFTNRLRNLVKYIGRDVRKLNTSYEISLSENAKRGDSSSSNILDVALDKALHVSEESCGYGDEVSLSDVIESFADRYPEQYKIISIMEKFTPETNRDEKTKAYLDHFYAKEYTSAIQKRVSRSRSKFQKFLVESGYEINF
ncbi:hypothetical protein [Jeotgalibacillus marinus]|uniref:Uncharacterized protein n=1 Tax=Jeotgalibacillus marinus TaxID=86667 RepID=A0ABV3Q4V9_9BACL